MRRSCISRHELLARLFFDQFDDLPDIQQAHTWRGHRLATESYVGGVVREGARRDLRAGLEKRGGGSCGGRKRPGKEHG